MYLVLLQSVLEPRTVSLISSRRKGETSLGIDSYGEEVGLARLYDFKAQSASYVNSSTIFESRLFDVKDFH